MAIARAVHIPVINAVSDIPSKGYSADPGEG